jgi:hypothetical protein
MIKGIITIVWLVALALVPSLADGQQQAKVPRIGYVSGTGDPSNRGPYVEAFRQGSEISVTLTEKTS